MQCAVRQAVPVGAGILGCPPLAFLVRPEHDVQAQHLDLAGLVFDQVGQRHDRVPLVEPVEAHGLISLGWGWRQEVILLFPCRAAVGASYRQIVALGVLLAVLGSGAVWDSDWRVVQWLQHALRNAGQASYVVFQLYS